MKHNYLLFILLCVFLFNCSSKETSKITNNRVIEKDTIYINSQSSISDNLYFSINGISVGDYWENENDPDYYYYYRFLFASIEERKYLYAEEIKIIDDGKVKLIKRIEVLPEIFGLDYYLDSPQVIRWTSPITLKLLINKKEYELNIRTMKIIS